MPEARHFLGHVFCGVIFWGVLFLKIQLPRLAYDWSLNLYDWFMTGKWLVFLVYDCLRARLIFLVGTPSNAQKAHLVYDWFLPGVLLVSGLVSDWHMTGIFCLWLGFFLEDNQLRTLPRHAGFSDWFLTDLSRAFRPTFFSSFCLLYDWYFGAVGILCFKQAFYD